MPWIELIEQLMCIGRIQTIDCRILIKTASAMDNIAKIYPSTWQGCWSSCLLWTEEELWQRRSQWCFTCNWVLWCEWTCKSEGTVFGSEWILHAGFLGCQSDRTGVHLDILIFTIATCIAYLCRLCFFVASQDRAFARLDGFFSEPEPDVDGDRTEPAES